LNSIRNIKKAIEFEIERLCSLLEKGEPILQQTRSFDANNDTTFSIRDKEDANDYRYFPDPDLAPFHLTKEFINHIRENLPALPNALKLEWKSKFGLSDYDVEQLAENKQEADFFIKWIAHTKHYKAVANWMLGPIREYLNETSGDYSKLESFIPALSELLNLVDEKKLNFSVASSKVFKGVIESNIAPLDFAMQHNLIQNNSSDDINTWIEEVLANHPEKVSEYKKGKKGLIGLFVGEVKKISKGKADPKMTTQLLEQKLN
jgi:aspartyl-tRNA(Asn)/glutamyl-tRNA(Gln) amidotransferase subunit B